MRFVTLANPPWLFGIDQVLKDYFILFLKGLVII